MKPEGIEANMQMENDDILKKRFWIAQKLVFRLLSTIQFGKLTIIDATGHHVFGGGAALESHSVVIKINDMRFYKRLLVYGTMGVADSYFDGEWDVDNLTCLFEIVIRNTELFDKIQGPIAKILNYLLRVFGMFNKNDIARSKQNILAHYDLGNEFFKLFLDSTMMYSCALYEPESISLEQASLRKLEAICEQLQLKPTDNVLEIGTGWGGFALYASRKYGCKVTTTTISDKQYAYVKRQIEHLGMQNRVELLNQDYRQLKGRFDKLVSIEMIEAVGYEYFDVFFKQCNALLKPGGLFFLQAITVNEQSYEQAKKEIDFIKKYIFPGGCVPSVNVISNCIASQTQMQLLHIRDIGKHYATTLFDWLHRFNQQVDQVKELGFSDHFIRMWRYYLCYCQAGFKQAFISDIHCLWRKSIW